METFELKCATFQGNTDNRIIIVILNPSLRARVRGCGADREYYEPKFVIPVELEQGRVVVALEDDSGQVVGGPWFDCEFKPSEEGWWTLLVEKTDE